MKYFIRIDNETVFVTEEIYKAYCQGQRKERYFRESDIHNKTVYYDALPISSLILLFPASNRP